MPSGRSVPRRCRLAGAAAHRLRCCAGVPIRKRHAELRGDHDVVAPRPECLAEDYLRRTAALEVGGVEEVDAHAEGGVDHLLGAGSVDVSTEAVGPEPDNGDLEVADVTCLHVRCLLVASPARGATMVRPGYAWAQDVVAGDTVQVVGPRRSL